MPGSAQCIANLLYTKKMLDAAAKQAVLAWGKETMKLSQSKYCPRKSGKLAASGKVEVTKNTLTEFYIRLSYNTPYALRQHETPWYHHEKGQWKYLSTPFDYRVPLLVKMVEAAWSSVL